jgi:hypothetical protein
MVFIFNSKKEVKIESTVTIQNEGKIFYEPDDRDDFDDEDPDDDLNF